jgi:di/tricarboxylate transporter
LAPPYLALGIFVAVFALATARGVHLGLVMFVAACVVGVGIAGMTLRDVIAGFPVGILVLVAGVTYFFGIAQMNGTVDRVMGALLARTRGRPGVVPVLFFGLAGVTAAMGSPQAGLATGPAGMSTSRRARVDPALMAIAINSGICAGSFAPTSLFGVITYRIAREAGIGVTTFQLLAVATVANVVLLVAALMLFLRSGPGVRPQSTESQTDATTKSDSGLTPRAETATSMDVAQTATLLCVVGLVPGIIAATLAGLEVDIGVTLLGLGVLLALLDPAVGRRAFARIDWSTAVVVGGIVTYVGVLQQLDAVNLLGRQAMTIGTPMLAALVICMFAALVSAFASTTGVLAALVPMAVPLASTGAVPGWALITTLGVSATIVDCSPFSNTGATLVASAPEDDRPRLRATLLRWSLAMVIVGPLVLLPLLVAFGR